MITNTPLFFNPYPVPPPLSEQSEDRKNPFKKRFAKSMETPRYFAGLGY